MPQSDLLKRYLDAGVTFTTMTRSRAEGIVRDLVKAGEVQTEQAQKAVEDLVERSRKNTERMAESIRKEIRHQISNLGLATQADIARLDRKIATLSKPVSTAKKTAKSKSSARKRAAQK
jgi:polyhydroxyalkanoate synthesis regulator phasin